jgi:hypothetical protein
MFDARAASFRNFVSGVNAQDATIRRNKTMNEDQQRIKSPFIGQDAQELKWMRENFKRMRDLFNAARNWRAAIAEPNSDPDKLLRVDEKMKAAIDVLAEFSWDDARLTNVLGDLNK